MPRSVRPKTAADGRALTTHRRPFALAAARCWWRCRLLVIAAACAVAAGAALQVLAPPPPPSVSVVVTARDVPAGHKLEQRDLAIADYPVGLAAPEMLIDSAAAVGRTPPVRIAAGTPLTTDMVSGGGLAALAPPGTAVVAVELDPVTAQMLAPGDRVDLISTGSDPPGYLARDALVMPVGAREADATGGWFATPAGPSAQVTLLAVNPSDAPAITAASGHGALAAVLVP